MWFILFCLKLDYIAIYLYGKVVDNMIFIEDNDIL